MLIVDQFAQQSPVRCKSQGYTAISTRTLAPGIRPYAWCHSHYFTTPNFAGDATLHKTGVKLELLTDYDQALDAP